LYTTTDKSDQPKLHISRTQRKSKKVRSYGFIYFVPFFFLYFFLSLFLLLFSFLPTLAAISLYLSAYDGTNIVLPICAGATRLPVPAEFP
jgi:hypothetical protein